MYVGILFDCILNRVFYGCIAAIQCYLCKLVNGSLFWLNNINVSWKQYWQSIIEYICYLYKWYYADIIIDVKFILKRENTCWVCFIHIHIWKIIFIHKIQIYYFSTFSSCFIYLFFIWILSYKYYIFNALILKNSDSYWWIKHFI